MNRFPEDIPLVALERGGLVESVHRGRVVVCDPDGNILEAVGDVDAPFFPRSAMKPFQAAPLVLSGASDDFGLTDSEIAVACASHRGETRHVGAVEGILEKAGLSEKHLDNGSHPPMEAVAAEELARRGEPSRRIHGNCSGKHAGMLAVCVHEGWDTSSYREPGHPLQIWIRELLALSCGVEADSLVPAGDGCGAPAYAVPMKSFATAFARLATGENLPDDVSRAVIRLRDAMRNHPFMVSGANGFDTEVMEKTSLVVKGGADGVWAAGSDDGWGMAIKISDGAARAVRPASFAALERRGIEAGKAASPLRDLHGEEVGEMFPLPVEYTSRP